MHTFAKKPNVGQPAAGSRIFRPTRPAQKPWVNALHRATTTDASPRQTEANTAATKAAHAPASAGLPTELKLGMPGDAHEQEADRVVERVMRMPEPSMQPKATAGISGHAMGPVARMQPKSTHAGESGGATAPPIAPNALRSTGQPLDPATRAFMEPRFGQDFGQVRVHADTNAAASAAAIGARAYTVGSKIVFGTGEYAPGTDIGRRLLSHELAHVVQQSRIGPALQPKLKFTGEGTPRVITLLNSGLQNYSVSMDASGAVSIKKTTKDKKPGAQEQALADRLTKIINDPKEVMISVSVSSKTLGGTFRTKNIDIADLEVAGVATLIHEIEEQYQGQVKGLPIGSETTGAHYEGIKAESEVMGANRGPQKTISGNYNPDKSVDAIIEIPYTYPDGKVKIKVMKVIKSNIISFDWKK